MLLARLLLLVAWNVELLARNPLLAQFLLLTLHPSRCPLSLRPSPSPSGRFVAAHWRGPFSSPPVGAVPVCSDSRCGGGEREGEEVRCWPEGDGRGRGSGGVGGSCAAPFCPCAAPFSPCAASFCMCCPVVLVPCPAPFCPCCLVQPVSCPVLPVLACSARAAPFCPFVSYPCCPYPLVPHPCCHFSLVPHPVCAAQSRAARHPRAARPVQHLVATRTRYPYPCSSHTVH
ncbi:unnamed protein product [Closterium sp. NIES-64]|nr:unnamed protein product [Closterium sp. NIES-64]